MPSSQPSSSDAYRVWLPISRGDLIHRYAGLNVFAERLLRMDAGQVRGSRAAVVARSIAVRPSAIVRQPAEQQNVLRYGASGSSLVAERPEARDLLIGPRPPGFHLHAVRKIEKRNARWGFRLRWAAKAGTIASSTGSADAAPFLAGTFFVKWLLKDRFTISLPPHASGMACCSQSPVRAPKTCAVGGDLATMCSTVA